MVLLRFPVIRVLFSRTCMSLLHLPWAFWAPLSHGLTASPKVGSYNQIGLCTSPQVTTEAEDHTISHYIPVLKKSSPSAYGQDDTLADNLWEYTEQQLRDWGN
ncbi:hypothetical protein L211DRAFT_889923 [Terfezia boudieri ATCC MYA-4762]|uniref:Uncharacterized protein n=1 Tax=Terfezia boudieri ATCC MYA-4762 TaxID=1051890 RepID=A0A3N4L824_9PEZI|nr:hypothetical protein L211DRAFT_889923 [Terfezia boudieri ATCC MYA-4762]